MDTTTNAEEGSPVVDGVDDLVASLDRVDPAEAPEIATEIARRLTTELDAIPPDARPEQLRAWDGEA